MFHEKSPPSDRSVRVEVPTIQEQPHPSRRFGNPCYLEVTHTKKPFQVISERKSSIWNPCYPAVTHLENLANCSVFRSWLTSIEHPRREPFWRAFWIILKRLGGAFWSSYHSAIPPVKSSKPSVVLPPDSASYDPFNLWTRQPGHFYSSSVFSAG